MHRAYVLLQVDGPEEIPDPEDPSKFTSVGVQVEDNKGWETLQRKRANTNMKNKSRKSPTQLNSAIISEHWQWESIMFRITEVDEHGKVTFPV